MTGENKKKSKKIIWWSVGIVLAVIAVMAGVFVFLFVSVKPDFSASKISDMDYFTGARLTQQVLYRTLKSKKDSEVRSLKISNREMQSLMVLAENGESLLYLLTGRKPRINNGSNNIYKISYDKEVFSFRVKLTDTFCNMCFIGHGKVKLKYDNGKLDIDFLSLKIGRFELSENMKDRVEKSILEYLKNDPAFGIVRSSVKNVVFREHGNITVNYYPRRLRRHIGAAAVR